MTQTNSWDASGLIGEITDWGEEQIKKALLGVKDAAEYVLGEAVDIVPLDTGDLSNSGRTSVDARTLTAHITFNAPYAAEQHENMTYQHSPGRRAKYLEIPLMSSRAQILELVRRRLAQ